MSDKLKLRQVRLFVDICYYIGLHQESIHTMLDNTLLDDGVSFEEVNEMEDLSVYLLILREIESDAKYYLESGRNLLVK